MASAMSLSLQASGSSLKITEKSESARREFFKKVELITKSHGRSSNKMQDVADQAAGEYNKLFGRIGVHPLLHLKGGKARPRCIIDREEVWVLYKPPLWQMGGQETVWRRNVEELARSTDSLQAGQRSMLKKEGMGVLQEWHGLTQGLQWIDSQRPVFDLGFIQRLDVETDGPVVCCKTWRAQRALQVQMREHVFSKAYMCLVHGRMENKTHYLKARFAELGAEAGTQVMLKHDAENDPFYHYGQQQTLAKKTRMAETFWKPLAYYRREQDKSEYSLVYVNILSGITHQVRITMQSEGHPLVGDDRYLPKDQALADLKWCPRNFLTEVRADWFDMFGPYRDEARRKYTRVSVENPLPKLFQQILESRLTLVEKLDPSADLYVGTEYWALGDEQLMNAYPKDDEYRRKVMRWGQRRGIHLETLDRLLLLSREDIDYILNTYTPPNDRNDPNWLCPFCMGYNNSWGHCGDRDRSLCGGMPGQPCKHGRRLWDNDDPEADPVEVDPKDPDKKFKVGKGFYWWLRDPTLHLLMVVNHRWLEARRQILSNARPSWEKPPMEADGTVATDDIVKTLEAALVLNLKQGGCGIKEEDLLQVPGLGNIKLPLGAPPEESNVNRTRLPGSGFGSRWMFTLKGKARIAHTADYDVKTHLAKPPPVETDKLPSCMVRTNVEIDRNRKDKDDKEAKELKFLEDKESKEREATRKRELEAADGGPEAKRWKKLESSSIPGSFYFFDAETGQTVTEQPQGFKESKPVWERIQSKTVPGEFFFFNSETGESRADRPRGVQVKNDKDELIDWKRIESKSKPGQFYFFNPLTNNNEVYPPTVQPPWALFESKTKKGQFYYYCEETRETVVDPPPSARPARAFPPSSSMALAEKAKEDAKKVEDKKRAEEERRSKQEAPPFGWRRETSAKYPGKFYYVEEKTGKTSWERPKSSWEKRSSKSNPGKFYFVHTVTGETKWQ